MKMNATVKERVFSISGITEREGIVLRTLLNLNEKGIREKLNDDELYWNDIIGIDEAVELGIKITKQIMETVDGE